MTKIDIFSGFLGAGKTTLIKKLIREAYAGEQVVLIENEFGEIGIDGGFMADAGINVTEMNSGCICCSLVGDFSEALQKVAAEYNPDRIVIEPSGVGKLSDVIKAVLNANLDNATLNAFCTVVDASKCKMYMKNFGEFFNDQVENASCIVLSHTAKAGDEKLAAAVKMLKEKNANASIVTANWDDLTGADILAAMENKNSLQAELENLAKELEHRHAHHHECDDPNCCCHDHHHHHEPCDHDHHDHNHHGHAHHECDDPDYCCHDHDHHGHHDHGHAHHECDDPNCCCHDHDHHGHHDHGHAHHECDDPDCCCHDHDHHGHAHHECDDPNCCCHEHHHREHHHHGHHDHGHHHADEVFTSWGVETTRKFTKEELTFALSELANEEKYGAVLRAKGIVAGESAWLHFDYVPEEPDVREGGAGVTGRLCVIGCKLNEAALKELFNV